ncbi:MAG TPA: protein kinase [Candidatus Hydrogenedentes bacterium]|nr:protein kinase [Candidatus Hydrogenedentota bacterium]
MAGAWNALCALLALHLKRLSRADLLEALGGASEDSSVSLPARLADAGAVSAEEAELIRRMAEAAAQAHGGDAGAALDSLGGEEALWRSLDPARTLSTPRGRTTTPMKDAPFSFSLWGEMEPIEEIPGRYTKTSEYGRGGMGRILLAHDLKMGRDVALKELLPTSETSMILPEKTPVRYMAAVAARFLQEGRVTAGLEHPSIVPVYEIGRRPNGNLYYTMKLVRGRSLARALRACSTLDERLALLPHFVDLCEAVAYAHSRGVLHRDIKPSNIMIGEFGETVVLDWGLAKVKSQPEDPLEQQIRDMPQRLAGKETPLPETKAGQAMGTPEYMPPEQAQGLVEQIDERSDLYSLGVVLYELLTGTTPFRADTASETMRRVILQEVPPVLEKERDAPPELVSICEKALQKKPSDRYESVVALAEEVKRFQTGALVRTYRYSLRELARRYYARHRTVLHVVAAAAGIILFLAVFSYIQIYQARNRERIQRMLAEDARDKAIVAEDRAEKAREEAEHTAYVAQIRLLQAYVRQRNFAGANKLVWSISEQRRDWEWGNLLEQCNQDLFTLRGHEGIVFQATFDKPGTRILTLAGDKTARIWNAADGAPLTVIKTPYALINGGRFSPDESSIVLELWDGTARLFDAATAQEKVVFKGHSASVRSAQFEAGGNRLVTGSNDGTVRIWDARSGAQLDILEGHDSEVVSVHPSPDGTTLISATQKGQLYLWTPAASRTPVQIMRGAFPVYSAAGSRVCYVDNGAAVVWDISAGKEIFRTKPGSADVVRTCFSPDDQLLLAAATDAVGRLYDVATGSLVNSFNHGEEVKNGAFSPDQSMVLLLSDAGLVTVWDIARATLVTSFTGHEAGVAAAAFSPDSQRIITAARDNTARVWDARRSLTQRILLEQTGPVHKVVVSGDGNRIAIATQDCGLALYDGRELVPQISHRCFSHFGPASAAFNADGSLLAAPLDEFSVFVLDTGAGETVSHYFGHRGRVLAIAFSPTGDTIVTGGRDGTARVWEARSGKEQWVLRGHTDRLLCVAFSPDGTLLATGANDNTVRLWDAKTGAELHVLAKHAGCVNDVAFDGDGSHLLSASNDGSVVCWDVESGEPSYQLVGHGDEVISARFSPDGARILTASYDETVRIWETGTGDELVTLASGDHPFLDAQFLQDSRSMLAAGWDGRVTAHFAGPWRMEQLNATPGSTLRERYAAAKASRLGERWPQQERLAMRAAIVHTTGERARERLERLVGLLGQPEPAPSSQAGLAIAEGPMADAMKRLCLLAGDRVTSINGNSIDGPPSARAVLAEYLENQTISPQLEFEIVREGSPIQVRFAFHPRIVAERTVTLPRETAREGVEYLAGVLLVGIEQLLQVNQDMNARLGEPVPSREVFNGLWAPPENGPQGARIYEAVGIAVGDHILRVNDRAIENRRQLKDFLGAARTALAENRTLSLAVIIERGEFQEIHLTINVP